MSTISLKVVSTSATKKQNANAKVLFGAKGETLLGTIEDLVKNKGLDTSRIAHVLEVLKNDETTAKYAASAGGKKNVVIFKTFLKAKTLIQAIDVITKIKVPKGFA